MMPEMPQKIENAVKERKVHRNAADFDGRFIRNTMLEPGPEGMEVCDD